MKKQDTPNVSSSMDAKNNKINTDLNYENKSYDSRNRLVIFYFEI